MNRIKAITVPLFFFSSAQAADLPHTSMATYTACRGGIEQWAQQFAPLSIETQVVRPEQTTSKGTRIELFVQVVYDTQGGPETRQANIECTVDRNGSVAVAEL